MTFRLTYGLAAACWLLGVARADDLAFFETRVRPVLAEHCFACHGPEKQKGGLRLDHIAFLDKGGDNGPALTPGDAAGSLLLEVIGYGNVELQMPPTGKLPDAAIADLTTWISNGAVWPDEPMPSDTAAAASPEFDLAARRAAHWAWQPLATVAPPTTRDAAWPKSATDRFILSKLEGAGLAPAPRADDATLFRRLSFDLTGLPPTPADARAYAADTAPDKYERAVARMLDSPHFGEHWARKWLDLTRFAETYGFEQDFTIPAAWRYRDYVIRALNEDVPYDQFLREHTAGDLLPTPRRHPETGTNESVLATGCWLMHQSQHAPVDVRMDNADRVDNRIDVFSKAFLGVTVSCARCHDHKFDAISTADYYALAGIFRSARQQLVELDPGQKIAQTTTRLAQLHARGVDALQQAVPATPAVASEGAFEDFSDGYSGWFASGAAFGAGPTAHGAWMPLDGLPHALPEGVAHSGQLGNAVRGVLRSPTFRLGTERIHFLAAGRGTQIRLIIEGFMLREIVSLLFESTQIDVTHGEAFQWLEMGSLGKYKGCQAYIELIDNDNGYLAVDEIRFSDAAPPVIEVPAAVPADLGTARPTLDALVPEMAALNAEIPPAERALALTDGNGVDEPIFVRGNPKNHGETVPRAFLEAIAGPAQEPMGQGSGRIALAERLLAPSNPLVSRVFVNRVWQHLFGRGLVPSVDNFGVTGQPPSHSELLDYLAGRFRSDGWSLKRLVRDLVCSETYRMGSAPVDARAEELDPTNTLLHRMPLRRLPAEPVRDAVLAVAGSLDATLGGESVPAYISPYMGGQRKPPTSGPMDGARRRSIYLEVRRNFLPAFLQAFDFPTPDTTHGARNVSNVPAQSLVLLNDPFVAEQAKAWAARACGDYTQPPVQRIEGLYWSAFARAPKPDEVETAMAFLRGQAAIYQVTESQALNDLRAWSDLCHVLYTVKEFVFIG